MLDPFAGTFTAAAIAKKLKRRSISIEAQEEYMKIGLRRILHMRTYKGEELRPPKKVYIRKNGNGKRIENDTGDLFDASSEARLYKETT